MSISHRVRIIADIPWSNFVKAVPAVTNVCNKMTANISLFPGCNPNMATYGQQVQDFSQSQQTVVTRGAAGATTLRLAKRDVVRASTEMQRAYVQLLCDQSPEMAATYATSSGFTIWTPGTHNRQILEADALGNGEVSLRAAASLLHGAGTRTSLNRFYLWRHTLDGKTFINDDPTSVAHTVITGLPANTIVGFEVAVKDSVGVGQWSQPVAILVA